LERPTTGRRGGAAAVLRAARRGAPVPVYARLGLARVAGAKARQRHPPFGRGEAYDEDRPLLSELSFQRSRRLAALPQPAHGSRRLLSLGARRGRRHREADAPWDSPRVVLHVSV